MDNKSFDLINRINSIKKLSKGQKLIVDYITNHYDKAAFMTAARLGEAVGVSESTVVRFALELGYEGYPKMQKVLQEMVKNSPDGSFFFPRYSEKKKKKKKKEAAKKTWNSLNILYRQHGITSGRQCRSLYMCKERYGIFCRFSCRAA